MRKSFKRVLTVSSTALAVVASLCVAAPAAQAAAPTCANVVANPSILGSNPLKIAVSVISARHQVLCVELAGFANIVVVVNSNAAITLPSVTPMSAPGSCTQPVINMTEPVVLSMSVGVDATNRVICFAKDGTATRVTFTTGSVTTVPDVEVWTLAYSTANVYGTCGPKYALYLASLGPWSDFYGCYTQDNQVI